MVTKRTFLPNYIEMGPAVSDKKIFKVLYKGENKRCPLAAMFFDISKWLEKSWYRVIEETFLPNYIEICPVVSDKKSFISFSFDCHGNLNPRRIPNL